MFMNQSLVGHPTQAVLIFPLLILSPEIASLRRIVAPEGVFLMKGRVFGG